MKPNSKPPQSIKPPDSQETPVVRKPATILTGKVSQQRYDDVVNREFERRRTTIDAAEPGNGD